MLRNGHAHTDTHNINGEPKWRQSSMANSFLLGVSHEEQARRERDVQEFSGQINYSKRYHDDRFEYRHVILPKEIAKYVPADTLLSEEEWRMLGVTQSPGWVHYMIHAPEPHIPIFRRPWDGSA